MSFECLSQPANRIARLAGIAPKGASGYHYSAGGGGGCHGLRVIHEVALVALESQHGKHFASARLNDLFILQVQLRSESELYEPIR